MSLKRSPKHGLSHSFILRKSVMCLPYNVHLILPLIPCEYLKLKSPFDTFSWFCPISSPAQRWACAIGTHNSCNFLLKNHLVQSQDIKNHDLTRCRGRRSNSGPQDPREPSKAFTRVCSGGTLFARGRLYPLFIWATFASMPSCTPSIPRFTAYY